MVVWESWIVVGEACMVDGGSWMVVGSEVSVIWEK